MSQNESQSVVIRFIVLVGVLAMGCFGYRSFGDSLKLESLVTHEQQLKNYHDAFPVFVFVAAFVIYVVVTGLSLPGAAGMTLAYGWFFGFVPTVILVSFASTTGASIAFLLSRYVFGTSIQERFRDSLATFNVALETDGPFYLLTLRLIPLVPFFVINVVMGLTRLRLRTFWLVSQVGMLPGTMAYVYAGSSVPDLHTFQVQGFGNIVSPQLLSAFVILGLLPLVLKKAVDFFGRSRKRTQSVADTEVDSDVSLGH
ncbi:MAG: TVP38/TMEM64 family protein [Fuerstiella sp.]|nr:TVP38/TMEM64 family protein [Fuerstiella sp.]